MTITDRQTEEAHLRLHARVPMQVSRWVWVDTYLPTYLPTSICTQVPNLHIAMHLTSPHRITQYIMSQQHSTGVYRLDFASHCRGRLSPDVGVSRVIFIPPSTASSTQLTIHKCNKPRQQAGKQASPPPPPPPQSQPYQQQRNLHKHVPRAHLPTTATIVSHTIPCRCHHAQTDVSPTSKLHRYHILPYTWRNTHVRYQYLVCPDSCVLTCKAIRIFKHTHTCHIKTQTEKCQIRFLPFDILRRHLPSTIGRYQV